MPAAPAKQRQCDNVLPFFLPDARPHLYYLLRRRSANLSFLTHVVFWCELSNPSDRPPISGASLAKGLAAVALPGLRGSGLCGARSVEVVGHHHLWLCIGTGRGQNIVAGSNPFGLEPGGRGPSALLARRMVHPGIWQRDAAGSGQPPPVCGAAVAGADGDMVCRVLPGPQPRCRPRRVCVRRRSV